VNARAQHGQFRAAQHHAALAQQAGDGGDDVIGRQSAEECVERQTERRGAVVVFALRGEKRWRKKTKGKRKGWQKGRTEENRHKRELGAWQIDGEGVEKTKRGEGVEKTKRNKTND
jgi:hypothetical protein